MTKKTESFLMGGLFTKNRSSFEERGEAEKLRGLKKNFQKNKKFSWQRLKDSSWWMAFHEKVGEEKNKFFEIY